MWRPILILYLSSDPSLRHFLTCITYPLPRFSTLKLQIQYFDGTDRSGFMWVNIIQGYFHLSLKHNSAAYPRDLPSESEEQQGDWDPSKLPDFVDKSEVLFSMYLDRSDEDDRKTTERWKGESDAILIFVSHSHQFCF